MRKSIYLAGPEVFLPDALAIGIAKKRLCDDFGFEGLFPFDNEIKEAIGSTVPRAIFDANIQLMRRADIVVANLTPFRGVSADVGTVFELSYAYAIGKRVFGYSNTRSSIKERIGGDLTTGDDGRSYATDGISVEDFDLSDNLMIAECLHSAGTAVVRPADRDGHDPWRDFTVFKACLDAIRNVSAEADPIARDRVA